RGLLFNLLTSAAAASVVMVLGVRWNKEFERPDELTRLGLPVLSTIWGKSKGTAKSSEETTLSWQRYVAAGAEFVLGAFIAAYIASCFFDPSFASLAGRDPLAGLCQLWMR